MIVQLQGRAHEVMTRFAIASGAMRKAMTVTTRVWFRELDDAAIDRYVSTGEGRDKAGSYALQGENGRLIERVDGSRANVMGLPLRDVADALGDLGIPRSAPHG